MLSCLGQQRWASRKLAPRPLQSRAKPGAIRQLLRPSLTPGQGHRAPDALQEIPCFARQVCPHRRRLYPTSLRSLTPWRRGVRFVLLPFPRRTQHGPFTLLFACGHLRRTVSLCLAGDCFPSAILVCGLPRPFTESHRSQALVAFRVPASSPAAATQTRSHMMTVP